MPIDFSILNQTNPSMQVAQQTQAAVNQLLDRAQKEREIQGSLANQRVGLGIQQQATDQQGQFQQGQISNQAFSNQTQQQATDQSGQFQQGQLANESRGLGIKQQEANQAGQYQQGQLGIQQQQVNQQGQYQQGLLGLQGGQQDLEKTKFEFDKFIGLKKEGREDEANLYLRKSKDLQVQQMQDFQQAGGDPQKTIQVMRQWGDVKGAAEVEKTWSDIQKNGIEDTKAMLDIQNTVEGKNKAIAGGMAYDYAHSLAQWKQDQLTNLKTKALQERMDPATVRQEANNVESEYNKKILLARDNLNSKLPEGSKITSDNPGAILNSIGFTALSQNADLTKLIKDNDLRKRAAPFLQNHVQGQLDAQDDLLRPHTFSAGDFQ